MDVQQLQELMQQLMQALEQIGASGEVLSDEFQGVVAQTLGNLYNRINELSQNESPIPPEPPSDIPSGPLPSAPSADAQLLWILAGQQPQAFISYLRTYPTAATHHLLQDPGQLNETISFLQQMMPQGEDRIINGIPHADLNSSNVWGANYDQKSGKMRVRFQGGSVYEYDGVPKNIFDAFIHGNAEAKTTGQNMYGRWWRGKNPSLGAALNQYVKAGGFNYRKIR